MDPIVTDNEEVTKWRTAIKEIVGEIDARIDVHDFRMVPGLTHTNLLFDVAVPFEVTIPEEMLKEQIERRVHALDPNYFTVITVDRM